MPTSSRGWVSSSQLVEQRKAERERIKAGNAAAVAAEMLSREEAGHERKRKKETGEGTWINPGATPRPAAVRGRAQRAA